MSVIYKNKFGWILDQKKLIADTYKNTVINCSESSFQYKHGFFNINMPFMMDSQFNARIQRGEEDFTNTNFKKKKRKRKYDLNEGELKAKELHDEILKFLLPAYKSLIDDIKDKEVFKHKIGSGMDNNLSARNCIMIVRAADLNDFFPSCFDGILEEKLFLKADESHKSLDNHLITNNEDSAIRIKIADDLYLIPPKCSFVRADVKHFKYFTHVLGLGEFDLILLDPPWENKSVKRLKQYWTLRNEDLFHIPIKELSAPGCIVAIWVTNRVKHIDFVKEELFPAWNVCYIAMWYWLKVTNSGETVYDIKSDHKKPYEVLILGVCRNSDGTENGKACENHDLDSNFVESHSTKKDIPPRMTIISVPCSIHSMKVPLVEILKPFLLESPKCLEIFARNLQPGWVCFGNEVYKHQHIDYFEEL